MSQQSNAATVAAVVREMGDEKIVDLVAEASGPVRCGVILAVGERLFAGSKALAERAVVNSGRPLGGPVKGGAKAKHAAVKAGAPAAAAPKATKKSGGAKRSPADLAALQEKVVDYVAQSPAGCGVEQIGKALGIPTKTLALPIKAAIKAGQLRSTGQKRATVYLMGPRWNTASNGAAAVN